MASALHSTVEGFMGGLKSLAKGTPARGNFITQHMNHAPFLSSLKSHPQGQQIHSMLTQHLNGANAMFRPGQTVIKAASIRAFRDELEKISISVPTLGAAQFARLEGRIGARAGWNGERVGQSLKKMMKVKPKALGSVQHAAPVEMLASSGPHHTPPNPGARGMTSVTRVGRPQGMVA